MLGGALLLGMISNSLNLLGVGVNLVYATQGALIFVAIVIDRLRVKFRGYLLHQEQVKIIGPGKAGPKPDSYSLNTSGNPYSLTSLQEKTQTWGRCWGKEDVLKTQFSACVGLYALQNSHIWN